MAGVTWSGYAAPSASVSVDLQAQGQGLEKINGIGPALSKKLSAMGVTLLEMADWNADDIDRYDARVKIKNHGAERWPDDARRLLEQASVVVNGEDGAVEEAPQAPSRAVPRPADAAPARRIRHRMNPNAKHSEIIGKHFGAAFEQDGMFFGRDGLEVWESGNYDDADVEPPIGMSPQTMARTLDLKAWRDGKTEYPFTLVRRAIKEKHGRYCASPTSARDFLLHRAKII
jgi:hypothetical protein